MFSNTAGPGNFPAQPMPSLIFVCQALRVKLVGVERNNKEAAKVVLQQLCLGKVMVGHVIKREIDSVSLVLYDTTLESDVNIRLVKQLKDNVKKAIDFDEVAQGKHINH